jgi:hypothetical protein
MVEKTAPSSRLPAPGPTKAAVCRPAKRCAPALARGREPGAGSRSAATTLIPSASQIGRLWLLVSGAVGLALFGTLMAPSRPALLGALLLLLVPLALLRRDTIVPALLTVLPFYTLVRRIFLLREPVVLNLDPLILLPDLLVLFAGLHLLARPFISRKAVQRAASGANAAEAWAGVRRYRVPARAKRGEGAVLQRPATAGRPAVSPRCTAAAETGRQPARCTASQPGICRAPETTAARWCRLQAAARRGETPSPARVVDYAVVLLIAISLLGFIVGTRNGLVPALNGARMFALYILLYFFARVTLRSYRQVGEILLITVFAGLVTGFYGIYQTLVGLPAYDQIYFANSPARQHVIGGFVRAFSTFQFTGHFSAFMLITFFVALTLFQQRIGRTLRLFCLITMLTAVAGIATTFVRSTWVGLVSALAAYALLQAVRRPLLRWAIVLALVPVIHFGAHALARDDGPTLPASADSATQVLQARAHSVFAARTDTDLFGRYLGLQAAFRAAATGPFGLGLGSTSAERFGAGTVAWTGDSQITTFLAELGWPGLLCFFAILMMVLRWSLKAIDATAAPDLRALLVGIASIQIGLLITSLTGGPLWYAQPTCVYGWLLTGIAVNLAEGQCSARGSRSATGAPCSVPRAPCERWPFLRGARSAAHGAGAERPCIS